MLPVIDKQLLFDHFADKTTPLQKRRIEEWLSNSANKEEFYAWLFEWENQNAAYLPYLDAPLLRFIDHMDKSPSGSSKAEPPVLESTALNDPTIVRLNRSYWGWFVAASVFIGGIFLGFFYKEIIFYKTYQTAYGENQAVLLADGSQVHLQPSSSLRVPRFGFNKRTREVQLKGEASFAVTHTIDNLKFLVKSDKNFCVLVHGTEFTVNTRAYRANVMLRKGKVQVNYNLGKAQKRIILKPGDLVALDQPGHPQLQHHIQPQVYDQWKEHRFIFDNMTLRDFGQMLTENYGLSVDIPDDTLAQRTLVGSFRADSVDELLRIIAEIFNLKVSRQGNTIHLMEAD